MVSDQNYEISHLIYYSARLLLTKTYIFFLFNYCNTFYSATYQCIHRFYTTVITAVALTALYTTTRPITTTTTTTTTSTTHYYYYYYYYYYYHYCC